MNKVLSFAVLAALALTVGCATADNTAAAPTTANGTPITLEQAMKQSQQARQQIETVKTNYQNVKSAAQASKQNGSDITTEYAKQVIQNKIDNTKTQVDSEVQAWKDILKN